MQLDEGISLMLSPLMPQPVVKRKGRLRPGPEFYIISQTRHSSSLFPHWNPLYSTFTFAFLFKENKIKCEKYEIQLYKYKVQIVLKVKWTKSSIFLFQLNFSEMCCTIIPYSRRFFVNRLGWIYPFILFSNVLIGFRLFPSPSPVNIKDKKRRHSSYNRDQDLMTSLSFYVAWLCHHTFIWGSGSEN